MEETEEKKKKTTSGFTEDISKEMSNSNPLPVEVSTNATCLFRAIHASLQPPNTASVSC